MQLIWSGPARRDLFAIAADYERIDPALADAILARVAVAPLALLDFPHMGSPLQVRGLRKWTVRKTPFILFYAVRADRVEIRRVIHGATNWRDG